MKQEEIRTVVVPREQTMIAYKVFNPDWTCRGFKYQVGETYEEDINPSVCDRGFHFLQKVSGLL